MAFFANGFNSLTRLFAGKGYNCSILKIITSFFFIFSLAANKSISTYTESSKLNLKENFIRSKFINEEDPIKAPFLGTKVLNDIDIDLNKLIFYLDTKALFSGQWQIKKGKNQSVDEYNNYLDSYAKPLLDRWLETIVEKKLISPKAVYGYCLLYTSDAADE